MSDIKVHRSRFKLYNVGVSKLLLTSAHLLGDGGHLAERGRLVAGRAGHSQVAGGSGAVGTGLEGLDSPAASTQRVIASLSSSPAHSLPSASSALSALSSSFTSLALSS